MSETKDKNSVEASEDQPSGSMKTNVLIQLSEILAVIFLVFAVIYFFFRLNLGWLFLAVSIALFGCAFALTYWVEKQASQRAKETQYIITKQRIETLKATGVPKDVRRYLETLDGQRFNREELSSRLIEALGPERTDETISLILKYTKAHDPAPA